MNLEEINLKLAELNLEITNLKELGNAATPEEKALLNEHQVEQRALLTELRELESKANSSPVNSGDAPVDYFEYVERLKQNKKSNDYSKSFVQLDEKQSGYARVTMSSREVGENKVEEARIKVSFCDIEGVEHVQHTMVLTPKQLGFVLPERPEYGRDKNLYKVDVLKGGFTQNPNNPGEWYHTVYSLSFQTINAEIVRIDTLDKFGSDFSLTTRNKIKTMANHYQDEVPASERVTLRTQR